MFSFTSKFLITAKEEDDRLQESATPIQSGGESTLNGLTIMSLENFVHSASSKTADEKEDDKDEEKDEGDKKIEDKKDDKKPKSEFGLGSKHRVVDDEEMGEYVSRIQDKTKTKQDVYNMPYIHQKAVKIVDGAGKEFNPDSLKAKIKQRPSKLLKKNEKMKHSDGTTIQYYNLGLPALKGLAVNESTNEFVIVDTCPGSGACKTYCYAMKGSYVMFEAVSMLQTQTLNFLLNKPEGFKNRLKAEIGAAKALNSYDDDGEADVKIVVRWHDAGDFFSPEYAKLAFDIANAFPDVDFYAYTKMSSVASSKLPPNFQISFSEGALPSEQKKVDLTKIKHSVVVPKDLFYDLINLASNGSPKKGEDGQVVFKGEEAWHELENRLVEKYKLPRETILSFNDYMEKKANDELGSTPNYWNVVVPPGGGDNSSNDNLVHGTYLLYH